MLKRDDILNALNKYLNTAKFDEANGLQVEGRAEVKKAAFGVSANIEFFRKAIAAGADLLITHHGLIWGKAQPVSGVFGRRVAALIKNDVNLASYHLPLDAHPVVGNNAQLAKALGLKNIKPFGDYHGDKIGFMGVLPKAQSAAQLHKKLGGEVLAFGPKQIKTIAIVSGGAHSLIYDAITAKADLFITGSRDEYIQELCRDAGLNFIAMGHYNSERYGILALKEYIAKKFNIETIFIDVPNKF